MSYDPVHGVNHDHAGLLRGRSGRESSRTAVTTVSVTQA